MKMSHKQIIIYLDCDFRQVVEGCEDLWNQARRSRNNLRPVVAFYFHPKINKLKIIHQESGKLKGSPDQSHFIFEIDVGKSRIRHKTTLNLNFQSIESI